MKNFAKLLFVITERDKKIEIRKEVLAQMKAFDPWVLFRFLTQGDKLGYLSSSALTKFLKDNNIEFDCVDEVSAFLESFAPAHAGKLSYAEFLDVVLPATRPVLR